MKKRSATLKLRMGYSTKISLYFYLAERSHVSEDNTHFMFTLYVKL